MSRTERHDEAEDQALVEAIRRGEQEAWTTLLTRYQDRLFGVCLRMVGDRDLAADLTQEAMVKIIQGLDTYDGRSRLSTWLIRVTMNVCLSRMRSERLRRHASLDTAPDGPGSFPGAPSSVEPTGHSGVERREQRQQLADALLSVNADHRSILILRDVRGLDYEQIGEALGIAVGTVKSRLFRARLALRRVLEREQDSSDSSESHHPASGQQRHEDR